MIIRLECTIDGDVGSLSRGNISKRCLDDRKPWVQIWSMNIEYLMIKEMMKMNEEVKMVNRWNKAWMMVESWFRQELVLWMVLYSCFPFYQDPFLHFFLSIHQERKYEELFSLLLLSSPSLSMSPMNWDALWLKYGWVWKKSELELDYSDDDCDWCYGSDVDLE